MHERRFIMCIHVPYENWRNFATFPCKGNSKIPATRNGFKDARFGQDVTAMLNAGYNIAMYNKAAESVTIDCDFDEMKGYNGIKALEQLETTLGKLPRTLTQKTPRGGRHYIFSDKGITNPIGKIGKDIDIKYNGYIMIAPSVINGRQYQIIDGIDENGKFIIADLPQAWLDYLNKDAKSPKATAYKSTNTSERKVCTNINIERMFNNCAFLRFCRDNAEDLPEPIWHSMITVLAQIKDSDELIHRLSEPYYGYSYDETQKKIDYARQFGHSQSCKYLSANYPEVCQDCHSAISERSV